MSEMVFSFEEQVLQRSGSLPVLVDFWAPWCGPCQTMEPVLTELSRKLQGQLELVKINVDEHPEIAQTFGISGIPALCLFRNGELISNLSGAQPLQALLKWLEAYLPNPNRDRLMNAVVLWERGDRDLALTRVNELLADEPNMEEARVFRAKLRLFEDPDSVLPDTEGILITSDSYQEAQNLRHLAQFLTTDASALPDSPAKSHYLTAVDHLQKEDFEQAIESLLDVLYRDKTYASAKEALIGIFGLLGKEHPLTKSYRRRFEMAMF